MDPCVRGDDIQFDFFNTRITRVGPWLRAKPGITDPVSIMLRNEEELLRGDRAWDDATDR